MFGVEFSAGHTGRKRLSVPIRGLKEAEHAEKELIADGYWTRLVEYPPRPVLQMCISRGMAPTAFCR
jgi:hypothetical protein